MAVYRAGDGDAQFLAAGKNVGRCDDGALLFAGQFVPGAGGRIVSLSGVDRTEEFEKGARHTLVLARRYGVTRAILKSESPSCGRGSIFDGSFSGILIDGNGVTADLLIRYGIEVKTELDYEAGNAWPDS